MSLAFEQYEGIAREWIHSRFYQLPESFVTQYASYIMKTTAADIEKAADRYIHSGDLVITVVGPKEELLPQLQEFGNVRIVPEI